MEIWLTVDTNESCNASAQHFSAALQYFAVCLLSLRPRHFRHCVILAPAVQDQLSSLSRHMGFSDDMPKIQTISSET